MMDPLSLTVGVFSLLGACNTVSKTLAKIRKLKRAPEIVQALNNEISDLRLILADVSEQLVKYARNDESIPTASASRDQATIELCSLTLERGKEKILQVEELIQCRLLKPGQEPKLRVNQYAFFRRHQELVQLQTDIRDMRQKTSSLFDHLGLKTASRIEVVVNQIHSKDLPALIHMQTKMDAKLDVIVGQQSNAPIAVGRQYHQFPRAADPGEFDFSSIGVSVSRVIPGRKPPRCTCRRQSSSVWLNSFFGTLFLGYTAAPTVSFGKEQCLFHETNLRLLYVFPIWLLKHAFSFHAELSTCATLKCSLAFRQVIPNDHVVFDFIDNEDFDGIRKLLVSGQLQIDAQVLAYFGSGSVRVSTPLRVRYKPCPQPCVYAELNYDSILSW